MGKMDFTRKECIKALKALGFIDNNSRRGRHDKFIPPENLKNIEVPCIMVPRHRELRCQPAILRELRAMGGKKLENDFLSLI